MTRWTPWLVLLTAPLATAADLEPEDVRPGLVAEYRSRVEPRATLTRIDLKPAFYLGRSSPHPRLPSGPFEVVWTGVIAIREPGPLAFSALVGGELTVTVGGVIVLDGRGTTDSTRLTPNETLSRDNGYYPVTVRYRSLVDVPARLQLWWEGQSFAREPLPAWRLGHVARDETAAVRQEEAAAHGRVAVGRLGCARCHSSAFPGVTDPAPGPSLADAGRRLGRSWVANWLADPARVRPGAHMPALFTADRAGAVERWLIADYVTGGADGKRSDAKPRGDHRAGRLAFLGLGCAACHFVPDVDRTEQKDLDRFDLIGLADRMTPTDLAEFLGNPHGRYPDGRMPRQPVSPDQARDIAAYLLMWSKPSPDPPALEPPSPKEIQDAARRLAVRDARSAATKLLREKGCVACHTGLGESRPNDVPIKEHTRGCLGDNNGPRFALSDKDRKSITAYLTVAGREVHPSPFAGRQHQLARAGCVRCHQRDRDTPPPIEDAGSTLGGAFLQELPFLRTPRLTDPHQKLMRDYIATTVREGSAGLRGPRYSYRMPAFGADAEALVQALAEGDGELPAAADAPAKAVADPTAGTLHGSALVGFAGYSCVSCHVWNGQQLAPADPGATGPDLTRTAGRLRRDWFDRFVENPQRYYPNTPMPTVFEHGKPAILKTVLDGDAANQKDAMWAYFALGKAAPNPKPPAPAPIEVPTTFQSSRVVAQIPIRFPDGRWVESLSLLYGSDDLLVYDLADGGPVAVLTGAQILRTVQGRLRQFLAAGTAHDLAAPPFRVLRNGKPVAVERTFTGYTPTNDGVRANWSFRLANDRVNATDSLEIVRGSAEQRLSRELILNGVPDGVTVELPIRVPAGWNVAVTALDDEAPTTAAGPIRTATLTPNAGRIMVTVQYDLPAAKAAPRWDGTPTPFPDPVGGVLERPGYRSLAYPRPKTVAGEDRVMPGAVAVRPRDGKVYIASLKTGELFTLRDPTGDGKHATFENFGHGLFQDALSMLADDNDVYVLHRRNLTRIRSDGKHFNRVAALPHGVADTYDYAYGLARDKLGRFVFSYAPYANATQRGAGGALRLTPGKPPEEIAFGMRNPLGWCSGPDGEIFFTDNQGEWVPANKLCHVAEGRYYGFPNAAQKHHATKPAGKTTVWVPYDWARSINGVAHDLTGGKFGPFAGQLFMAELMYGGAIIRADVEKVNGVYQGACFPFWGKGLLGPVCLAFDPKGKLYVGGITEPGWMAQPDRGAMFRIDFTGKTPFEMQTIRVSPQGFRITFTAPVDGATAAKTTSYRLEHYRYEYTGAYGSPELDRTAVKVELAEVSADGRSVDLTTAPLVKDRVYMIHAGGVRSTAGEVLVQPAGAYTLNEIPAGPQ